METALGLILPFATSGELNGIRIGTSGEDADRRLGGGTSLGTPSPTEPERLQAFKDGSLEVWTGTDGSVCLLGFDRIDDDGQFAAPRCVGAAHPQPSGPVTYEALVDRLATSGCAWREDPALTFDDQLSIRTAADVSICFARPEGSPGAHGWVLRSLYASTHPH